MSRLGLLSALGLVLSMLDECRFELCEHRRAGFGSPYEDVGQVRRIHPGLCRDESQTPLAARISHLL